MVEVQIGRHVDKAFVDGIDVNVLRTDVFQVDTVNLCRHLHVVLHARYSLDVVDAVGNLEQATAVMDSEVFHGLGNGEADGRAPARFVGNDQVGGERIEPAVDALDAGVKRLKVDTDVRTPTVLHRVLLIKHMFPSNTCSIIPDLPKRNRFILLGKSFGLSKRNPSFLVGLRGAYARSLTLM